MAKNNQKYVVLEGIMHRYCIGPNCPNKGVLLSEDNFHRQGKNSKYLMPRCAICCNNASAIRSQRSVYRRRYGIEVRVYDSLFKEQNGRCRICGTDKPGGEKENVKKRKLRYFCIDHCHDTGKIRGLLCSPCNRALGLFGDDLATIEKAVRYLKTQKK